MTEEKEMRDEEKSRCGLRDCCRRSQRSWSPFSPLRFFYLTSIAELEAQHSLGVAGRRRVGRRLRRSIAAAAGRGRLGRGGLVARRGCLTRRSLPRLPALRRLLVAGLCVQVGRSDVAARFVARIRHRGENEGGREKGLAARQRKQADRAKQVSQGEKAATLVCQPSPPSLSDVRVAVAHFFSFDLWRTAKSENEGRERVCNQLFCVDASFTSILCPTHATVCNVDVHSAVAIAIQVIGDVYH